MESKQTIVQGGGSLFGLAFITTLVFFILKVTNVLKWTWMWVLSPLWIYALLWVGILILAFLIFLFLITMRKMGRLRRDKRREPKPCEGAGVFVPDSWWRS